MNKKFQEAHRKQIESEVREKLSKDRKSIRNEIINFEGNTISSLFQYVRAWLEDEVPNITFITNSDFKIGMAHYSLRINRDFHDKTKLEMLIGQAPNTEDFKGYVKKRTPLFTGDLVDSSLALLKSVEIWVSEELERLSDELIRLVAYHFQTSYQVLRERIRILFLTKPHPWAVLDLILKEKLITSGLGDIYPEVFLIEVDKTKGVKYIMTVEKAKMALKLIARENYESNSPLELVLYMLTYKTPYEEAFAAVTADNMRPMHYRLDEALYASTCPQMKLAELALMGNDFEQWPVLIHGHRPLVLQFSKKHHDVMNDFWVYNREDFNSECEKHLKPTMKKQIQNIWFNIRQRFYAVQQSDIVAGLIRAGQWYERVRNLLRDF